MSRTRKYPTRGRFSSLIGLAAGGDRDDFIREFHLNQDSNQRGPYGETVLHWWVMRGNSDVVALLLRSGVDAAARDANGDTPAGLARKYGRDQLASLIERSAAASADTTRYRSNRPGSDSERTP